MFAAERLAKIRNILLDYKHMDVTTLSSMLSVSEATIRRDLDKLEEEGFLLKTHGGAVISDEGSQEVQLNHIEDPYLQEKRQVGLIAAHMINNNEAIFLGAGNTCLHIAKNIKDKKDLTVVTNNINIVLELSNCNNINLLVAGGNLESIGSSLALIGQFAKKTLEGIFLDKAFLSVNGVSLKYGYTVSSSHQAEIYDILMKNSDEVIIAADYSKFDKRSFTPICPINAIKKVITNAQLSLEYKQFFFDNNIQVFTAFDENKEFSK